MHSKCSNKDNQQTEIFVEMHVSNVLMHEHGNALILFNCCSIHEQTIAFIFDPKFLASINSNKRST